MSTNNSSVKIFEVKKENIQLDNIQDESKLGMFLKIPLTVNDINIVNNSFQTLKNEITKVVSDNIAEKTINICDTSVSLTSSDTVLFIVFPTKIVSIFSVNVVFLKKGHILHQLLFPSADIDIYLENTKSVVVENKGENNNFFLAKNKKTNQYLYRKYCIENWNKNLLSTDSNTFKVGYMYELTDYFTINTALSHFGITVPYANIVENIASLKMVILSNTEAVFNLVKKDSNLLNKEELAILQEIENIPNSVFPKLTEKKIELLLKSQEEYLDSVQAQDKEYLIENYYNSMISSVILKSKDIEDYYLNILLSSPLWKMVNREKEKEG